jgi:hypothetical protein
MTLTMITGPDHIRFKTGQRFNFIVEIIEDSVINSSTSGKARAHRQIASSFLLEPSIGISNITDCIGC